MTRFKKNNYIFWHSPIVLFFLFCFFVFFVYSIFGLIEKQRDTAVKKEIILEEIDKLKKKESDLNSVIAKLNTDEGVEEVIRDKYNVVKTGEKIIVIVDDDREKIKEDKEEVSHSFFGWIKNMFR